MNATTLLASVTEALAKSRLEAVLIGNAAAALHGAPVTTLDFDFMFRVTPYNLTKLRAFARCLDAYILRPYYPVSNLYRVVHDERGLQVDFMGAVHGVRSFERLRSGAETMHIGGYPLALAALRDIIASKRAAGRNRDQAVLEILEHTLHEKEKFQGGPIAGAKKGK